MNDRSMEAIRYHEYGGVERLVSERTVRPEPPPGQVLIRVKAAGVTPFDWKLQEGWLRDWVPVRFPNTPGVELAGVVEEVGAGVTGIQTGQAVYGTADGGAHAQYAVTSVDRLAPKPESITFDEAASVPIGVITAWESLFDTAGLQSGQRLLVRGAAGGVGSFAVQLGRWKGAHVIGAASARNVDFVRSLGADEVIDYEATPFETAAHGVDVIVDTVGFDGDARALQPLRAGGIYVSTVGPPPQEEAQKRGITATYVRNGPSARHGELLRRVNDLIEAGQLKPHIRQVFSLSEARQAQALCRIGHGRGRIVLHIAD